jgi:hypothetical protein
MVMHGNFASNDADGRVVEDEKAFATYTTCSVETISVVVNP